MATIVGDVTGLQQRHLPLKAKSFRNITTYKKIWGGVPSTLPPYHGGGMNLRVRPRVNIGL